MTRSGVLQSVHSFGAEEKNVPIIWQIGNIFLAFMALIIALSIIMAFLRRGMLKPQKGIKSEISKESIIFDGVILVLLLASVVFYGVTSPIFYKIFLGKELHNGIDFYNPKAVPIALFILLIVPIANIATWEKGEAKNFFRKLIIPSLFGVLSILLGLLFLNYQSNWLEEVFKEKKILFYFLLLFFNIGFFLSISIGEYLKEARKAKQKATSAVEAMVLVFKEKKKKLGVSLIHFGIIVFCFGIAFSSFFQENYEEDIRVGESFKADGVVFSLARLTNDDFNQDIDKVNQIKIWAEIDLYKNSKYIGTLKPMRVHYKSTLERGQPPSYEVAIKSSLFKDYYIILGGFDLIENRASLTLHVNTFVSFLWLGGFIILIGGILALVYEKRIIWY
ncbi:MAG: hypothetical protein N2445_03335 [Acidobacteria bacterium]|nr:hypothetical protein [Acidobacteriota bacterium]